MNPCPATNRPEAARSRSAVSRRSRVRHGALSSLAVALFFAAAAAPSFAQYALTCASEDGHRHYCAADTRAGVSLTKQHSKSACTQGQTWGFDQQGVWVDRGCRADFLVNAPQVANTGDRHDDHDRFRGHDGDADHDRDHVGDHRDHDGDTDRDRDREHDRDADRDRDRDRDHDRDGDREHYRDADRDRNDYDHGRDRDEHREQTMQLTCASEDGGRHYCESDIQGQAVMLRQRSGSPCREGYSWGNDRRGIWVDHGCRADFSLTGFQKPPVRSNYAPAYMGTFKCSSDFGTRQYCQVDTRGRVRLSRQISESSCREGYSWGYDRSGVWVDHGCRAEFEIGN